MLEYSQTITEFIKTNFTPGNPEGANVKFTTADFLCFLFKTFPDGCISDYELNEILITSGFQRFTYSVEHYSQVKKNKKKFYQITKSLEIGWCLISTLDLKTEEIEKI